MDALEQAGHPVLRIPLTDRHDLGAEFFRWEFATAVAGSVLGIHAFNQPDVEATKVETREADRGVRADRRAAGGGALLRGGGDQALRRPAERARALRTSPIAIGRRRVRPRSPGARGQRRLSRAPCLRRDERGARGGAPDHAPAGAGRKGIATCLGFGPRFLHSTGQAYKGGPNSGVMLQITCDDAVDLPVPGQNTPSGWSRRRRRGATSRSWPSAGAASCASISGRTSRGPQTLTTMTGARLGARGLRLRPAQCFTRATRRTRS